MIVNKEYILNAIYFIAIFYVIVPLFFAVVFYPFELLYSFQFSYVAANSIYSYMILGIAFGHFFACMVLFALVMVKAFPMERQPLPQPMPRKINDNPRNDSEELV